MSSDEFSLQSPEFDAHFADRWDRTHRLRPLAEVAGRVPCRGVTRVYDVNGDDGVPEFAMTCWWGRHSVAIEVTRGFSPASPDDPPPARWFARLPLSQVLLRVRGWARVAVLAETVPECRYGPDDRLGFGGTLCGHRAFGPGVSNLVWWSPVERHVEQWAVIRAFRRLRRLAWLWSWLTGRWCRTRQTVG